MDSEHRDPLKATHRLSRRGMIVGSAASLLGARLAAAAPSNPVTRDHPAYRAPAASPDLPWATWAEQWPDPGEPGKDYDPVFTPNNTTLPFRVSDGVKIMHLIAEPIVHEVCPGLVIDCWGYNGSMPGPTIEVVEGDRVRIYVTNRLPVATSVHWHGIILPCGMDGVAGMTQWPIQPGETYVYEYIFPHAGMYMYHPHVDTMTQEGMGMIGAIVVHPRNPARRPDRDFVLMLHEWAIDGGTSRPDPFEMKDFNVLTLNGKVGPATYPLVAQLGDRVRIRIGNLSAMDHHPIHLHGYRFHTVETDGGPIPESAQWPDTTVLVSVGQTRTIEFLADNPGDWMMHCHMTHHAMNQMGHGLPNPIGVVPSAELDAKIRSLIPGYMFMGSAGMEEMATMRMPVPANSIPMLGHGGQFGPSVMGGMMTMLKVREKATGYDDPGDYQFPDGTVSRRATEAEMKRDRISPPASPTQSTVTQGHDH